MKESNKYTPPRQLDSKDYMAVAAKAGVAAIPFIGGPANELLNALIVPSLERRKYEWMAEVGQGLLQIENRLTSLEDLQSKESFIDVAIEASRMALSTSQKEVRSSLKNAVLNSAVSESIDEAKQKLFLQFLDAFTEWHIRFIKLFDEPRRYMQANKVNLGNLYMGGITNLIEASFPQLKGQEEFSDAIWNELYGRKIFNTSSIHGTMSLDGIISRRTTELGREFLRFIEFE